MQHEEMQTIPQSVLDLVDRFERNRDAYKAGSYKETQVRREFIDPLFKALGWDIDNTQGYAEAYKDVIHEDAIKVGEATKAPDYCFRIGGTRKFFLEAKKPAVDIKHDVTPAFQLRRYGWTSKLPLSILTDFEELAVYDCRFKPDQKDSAGVARIRYIPCTEYAARWHEIVSVFSRDAVLKGSFDKYAESNKAKRGTVEVDEEFLKTIEFWRKALAENLILRNKALSQRELNFAVQRIIDRIIFLRICEGRGIEDYGGLRVVADGDRIYPRLGQLFKRADDRFNSGLFHFKSEKGRHESPDEFTLHLKLDDKLLRSILKSLYYPESPYVFSALPADVLGQVYEQFLGKVIRLTEGHHAKVDDKPEVKKAGGVYYTPTYIVEYIVHNTVGHVLEHKTPKQVAALKILDPACGSGSFLLGAYDLLLKWHLDFYTKDEAGKYAKSRRPLIVQSSTGGWKLTIAERKRILINNIYGVDIDSQAVETTKLSLLLKVLEGETSQTIQPELLLERALPDLGDNVKCGNSIIGPDFYNQQQLSLLDDEEERYRINVFDWRAEFSEVISAGGFDVVIGNPPWGASLSGAELDYLRRQYHNVVARMVDSYIYFVARADQIAKPDGPIGYIVPSTILNQVDTKPVRELLLRRGLTHIISLGQGIFGAQVLNTSTMLISGSVGACKDVAILDVANMPLLERARAFAKPELMNRKQWEKSVESDPYRTFFTGSSAKTNVLIRLRENHNCLASILVAGVARGVTPDVAAAHVVQRSEARKLGLESALLRPSVSGSQIKRYQEWTVDQFIIYTTRDTEINAFPRAKQYLARFRDQNSCPEVKEGKHPVWSLHRPRDSKLFDAPKFIGITTSKTIELIYDEDQSICVTDAMYIFATRPRYDPYALMAVLQSKLFLFLYRTSNQGDARVIPQVKASRLEPLPFPDDFLASPITQKLSVSSQLMYQLRKRLSAAKTSPEVNVLERQIEATDKHIDRLVYDLYGLTVDEIQVVDPNA
jgi:type I restriction-modification system DNA methylase subunit